MKINKIILAVLLPIMLSSCEQWLDVAPDDQVNEETLFANGDGYRNALNGVYRDMATTQRYGRELTWGCVDVMGWVYDPLTIYYDCSNHEYYDVLLGKYNVQVVKNISEAFWSQAYNSIANCNNIIARIDGENPSKFAGGEEERNMIHGEALALRAYLHFDMLRLFAPAPKVADDKGYIPYYERYGSTSEARASVPVILEKIERDLLKAKDLVAPFDTTGNHKVWMSTRLRIEGGRGSGDSYLPDDLFYMYRGFRMNYYAICATLARVYSYGDKQTLARECAEEVVEATYPQSSYNTKCFTFTGGGSYNSNYKLYDGVIFGLSNQKLIDDYSNYLGTANDIKLPVYYDAIIYNENYDEVDTEDARLTLFSVVDDYYYYSKKYTTQVGNSYGEDLIPMIRLSEMYYIISEALYTEGQTQSGINKLDEVRMARGIRGGKLQIESLEEMQKAILRDARRDFIGEGQLFYYYKKYDMTPNDWGYTIGRVLPLPDNQLIH